MSHMNLDTNLESIPYCEVSSGLMDHIIHLNGSLIHKVGCVELVVVMEANNPLCYSIYIWLVWHVNRQAMIRWQLLRGQRTRYHQ